MSDSNESGDIRIVQLAPMRVATVHAEGVSPEMLAMARLLEWARPHGLLEDPDGFPVFGFNDPDPDPARETYGYRFWIRVPDDLDVEGRAVEAQCDGGLYAVSTCDPGEDPCVTIPAAWKDLHAWVQGSDYAWATHRWLERHRFPRGFEGTPTLDLYCPVRSGDASVEDSGSP